MTVASIKRKDGSVDKPSMFHVFLHVRRWGIAFFPMCASTVQVSLLPSVSRRQSLMTLIHTLLKRKQIDSRHLCKWEWKLKPNLSFSRYHGRPTTASRNILSWRECYGHTTEVGRPLCCLVIEKYGEYKHLFGNPKTSKKEILEKIASAFSKAADVAVSGKQCMRKWLKLKAK